MTRRTELHIRQGNVTGLYYRNNVIELIVLPYTRRHGNAFVFQDGNARDDRTCVVQDHLQFCRITTLPWPAKSPDLSPVVYLWDILGRRVRKRPHKPQDIKELANALLEEWCRIPQSPIWYLIRSMGSRCLMCLAPNGCPTRYWDFCEIDQLMFSYFVGALGPVNRKGLHQG